MYLYMKQLVSSFFDFLKSERRSWVIVLIFLFGFSYTFQYSIENHIFLRFDPVKEQTSKSQIINNKLNEILDEAEGSRVYIFQFHNGMNYYTGAHAQRFTCTYEVVRDGISREANNLQDLQVSIFSWWVEEVLIGRMIYSDVQQMEDYTTRVTLQQQGIQSIICYPLVYKGKIVGVMGVDYVRRSSERVNDPAFQSWFSKQTSDIAELIGT